MGGPLRAFKTRATARCGEAPRPPAHLLHGHSGMPDPARQARGHHDQVKRPSSAPRRPQAPLRPVPWMGARRGGRDVRESAVGLLAAPGPRGPAFPRITQKPPSSSWMVRTADEDHTRTKRAHHTRGPSATRVKGPGSAVRALRCSTGVQTGRRPKPKRVRGQRGSSPLSLLLAPLGHKGPLALTQAERDSDWQKEECQMGCWTPQFGHPGWPCRHEPTGHPSAKQPSAKCKKCNILGRRQLFWVAASGVWAPFTPACCQTLPRS